MEHLASVPEKPAVGKDRCCHGSRKHKKLININVPQVIKAKLRVRVSIWFVKTLNWMNPKRDINWLCFKRLTRDDDYFAIYGLRERMLCASLQTRRDETRRTGDRKERSLYLEFIIARATVRLFGRQT